MVALSRDARRVPGTRDERRWLAGLAIVTACSWGRWAASGSLKVDESYPSVLLGSLLLLALAGGYGLTLVGWAGLLARPPSEPRRLAYAGLAVAGLMLPMLSNDVFSAFAYGSLAAHGQDVYTSTAALRASEWYPWIGARWDDTVCVYGPTTLTTLLPVAWAASKPFLALVLVRLAWFAPLLVVMELSFRQLRERPFFHVMLWLNPLFLVEGPGQLHPDLVGVAAVTAGILLQREGRLKSAWAALAVAILTKYTFAMAGVWFWLAGARSAKERMVRLPVMGAIFAAIAAVEFAPYWNGLSTVTTPIRALAQMNPGSSLTEVAGIVVHMIRGGSLPAATMDAQALAADRATHAGAWFVASLVLGIVVLRIAAYVVMAMLRSASDDEIALGTGVIMVAVTTLASRRFEPWYLLVALPFFGLRCTSEWRRWWIAIVGASVAPTFTNVLPRTAPILAVWIGISTALVMALFLLFFRERYLSFGADEPSPSVSLDAFDPAID